MVNKTVLFMTFRVYRYVLIVFYLEVKVLQMLPIIITVRVSLLYPEEIKENGNHVVGGWVEQTFLNMFSLFLYCRCH